MTPPTASFTTPNAQAYHPSPVDLKIKGTQKANTVSLPRQRYEIKAGQEPKEDFNGNYVFADIKESITARAMTTR